MADKIQVNYAAAETVATKLTVLSQAAAQLSEQISPDLGESAGAGAEALEALAGQLQVTAGKLDALIKRSVSMIETAVATYAAADGEAASQF